MEQYSVRFQVIGYVINNIGSSMLMWIVQVRAQQSSLE